MMWASVGLCLLHCSTAMEIAIHRSRHRLRSSAVQFGLGLSLLNRFELGLARLKPNQTVWAKPVKAQSVWINWFRRRFSSNLKTPKPVKSKPNRSMIPRDWGGSSIPSVHMEPPHQSPCLRTCFILNLLLHNRTTNEDVLRASPEKISHEPCMANTPIMGAYIYMYITRVKLFHIVA